MVPGPLLDPVAARPPIRPPPSQAPTSPAAPFRCCKALAARWKVFASTTAIPASHAFIHGKKVAFGLLTQLVLEGRPQAEIEVIYCHQKAVGLPITLVEVGVEPPVTTNCAPSQNAP